LVKLWAIQNKNYFRLLVFHLKMILSLSLRGTANEGNVYTPNASCTACTALVAAKILLVTRKILLVAMPRRDQWKKNSVGRNKNPVGRDEGRCSGWWCGGC
jgi:hypothetical protein